jgi:hypothetical protein
MKYHKGGDPTHVSTLTTLHPSPCSKGCRSWSHLLKKHGHCFQFFKSEGIVLGHFSLACISPTFCTCSFYIKFCNFLPILFWQSQFIIPYLIILCHIPNPFPNPKLHYVTYINLYYVTSPKAPL